MEDKLNVLAPEVAKVDEIDKNNFICFLNFIEVDLRPIISSSDIS